MHILISGAGIAGTTAAWWLAKAGARVTVVEKAKELLAHGQNVDINDSAIKVIQKMGLLDEVRRYNTTEKGTVLLDSKNRPFARFPVTKDSGVGASPTSEYEILRGDLAKLLYNATRDFSNVDFRFDTTIRQVVTNNDNSVAVELSDGSKESYDVLIAADGQWSRVRKQCFSPEAVTVSDRGMYAVYWTIPKEKEDTDWWQVYWALDSRIITIRPDPHGTMRAMFTYVPRTPARKQAWGDAARGGRLAQEKLVAQEFAGAGWHAQRFLDSMAEAPDFYFQSIQQIIMPKWHNGRVVCLGDTAYCPTPTSGMGTTAAIMGAYVLAGELMRLKPGQHPNTAFEEHERVFRPVIKELGPAPKSLVRLFHADKAWKRWLLQTVASFFAKVIAMPWVAKRLAGPDGPHAEQYKLPDYTFDGQSTSA